MIKIASLFSGIGGFEKGILQAVPDVEIVFSSEIDKYARQIYKKNYGVEPHGDITKIKASSIPDHDILCGGFPCQAFSIAGKRRGFEDTRGTLFFEIMRIAKVKRPKLLYFENVKGLLSSKTYLTFESILPLLYEEVMSDTQWELQYTPLNNWILFADNIQSYIVTKWPNISEFQKKQSGTYSIKNLEYRCGNLEDCLNTGAKKRLTFLKTQILQILKKLSNYQKEQMHLSECNEEDLVFTLNQLCSIENLNKMDIHILEKIMDMCGDVGKLRVQNLDENLIQTRWFTTSMAINWTTEPKIFGYVQELSIIGFILKQWNLSTNLWKQVLSNLIEKKESMFYVGTFSIILQTLHEHGYDAEWQVFNSKNHGVPQNRERVFIIGHLRGAGTRPIFPITNSIEEISKERDGDDISTGCISTRNQSGQAQWDGSTTLIANAIDANYYKGIDNHGQRTAILCDSATGHKYQLRNEIIAPLRANTGAGHNNIVCHSTLPRNSTLGTGGTGHLQRDDDLSYCCDANNNIAVEVNQQIRRLTPMECERLQGFPDNWTKQGTTLINNVHILGNVCQKINVQLMDVKGKLSTGNQSYALCITKDGRNGAIRTSHTPPTKKMLDNVVLKGVLEIAIAENCVCDITNHGNDMVMLSIQTNTLKIEEITKKNLILERMEERYTKPLLRIKLEENLTKERLFTTLTWIKEIIKSRIFTCVKTGQPIMDVIIHWNSPQHNSLKPNILFSRMENIESISDTQRYKCLGNAVTVNVIEFISLHIKEMLLNKDA